MDRAWTIARVAAAVLPGVDEGCRDGTVDRGLEVGVVEDHEGGLAAELEVDALAGLGGDAHDVAADGGEPVKETIETSGWPTRCCPATAPVPVTTLTTPGGAGLGERLGEEERGERGDLGRLEDDRVAGGDGRQDLPRGHLQRVVPGGDRADDADRLAADGRRVVGVLGAGHAVEAAAAVPKNAVLSTVPGTSNSRARRIGLPAWRDSSRASSSARSSSSRAALSRTEERSTGVARLHSSKAVPAAATAASTSACPARSPSPRSRWCSGRGRRRSRPRTRRAVPRRCTGAWARAYAPARPGKGPAGTGVESAAKAATATDPGVRGGLDCPRRRLPRSQEHFARSEVLVESGPYPT